jgi:fluoride exporter
LVVESTINRRSDWRANDSCVGLPVGERRFVVKTWVIVAFGGALGSAARHAVNVWTLRRFEQSVPLATGIVNVAGCAIVGILAGLIVGGQLRLSPSARIFAFVGLLGGFTTFSSLGLDTLTLVHESRVGLAASNVLLQVGLGLAVLFACYSLAPMLWSALARK